MSDTRHKNTNWNCLPAPSFDSAQLAVLMDIRDELQTLNRVFQCSAFLEIPRVLRAIRRNTIRVSDGHRSPLQIKPRPPRSSKKK